MNRENNTDIVMGVLGNKNRHKASELLLVAFLAVGVIAALIAMLDYSFVAARPPLVIAIPLLILILIHGLNVYLKPPSIAILKELKNMVLGGNKDTYRLIAIFAWMILFLVIVITFGHYPGMCAFIFILMKFVSAETTRLAVLVSLGTAGFIYLIFTFVLGIELYDGVVYMLYQGHKIF